MSLKKTFEKRTVLARYRPAKGERGGSAFEGGPLVPDDDAEGMRVRLEPDLELADPQAFFDAERGYDLLQEYFRGLPIATLRPLSRSAVYPVQRTAAFVLSELGRQSAEVVDDAIPLLSTGDRALCFAAMEAIAVCSDVTNPSLFLHVVNMLESEDEALRELAMYLATRVSLNVVVATKQAAVDPIHQRGLSLLTQTDAIVDEIRAMLESGNALLECYGAIAAKRTNDTGLAPFQ